MNGLKRNATTAQEAIALEDAEKNPFLPNKKHTAGYFQLLTHRRENLPVCAPEVRQEFLEQYQANQVTIVVGDTGCGKTTQLLQFILFDEWQSRKSVVCTQTRPVAATSVATRVAQEMDVPLGGVVGYGVRSDDKSGRNTRLHFVTDGRLLKALESDRLLSKYACVVIDDVHERTTNTDMLLALVKHAQTRRKDLKLVIMSATINLDKFKAYFDTNNVFNATAQTHAVKIYYLKDATPDYFTSAVRVVQDIVARKREGNILVFMTSVREIEEMCARLRTLVPDLRTLPMYAALPKYARDLVISGSSETQTCVVSTNVVEASLTIPGIVYVVDTGLQTQSGFNSRTGMTTLLTAPISQASARQRAGRAGRTQPGVCFRLYTEKTHDEAASQDSPPGIHMTDLTEIILRLKTMGFDDLHSFDWIDPPHMEDYLRGVRKLREMGYLDSECKITTNGTMASRLPVHCAWYNALHAAHGHGCLDQMITIAALLSTQDDILMRPHVVRYAADVHRGLFGHPASDHLVRLNAIHKYVRAGQDLGDDLAGWCKENMIHQQVAEEVLKIRQQLSNHIQKQFLKDAPVSRLDEDDEEYDFKIRKSLLAGFFFNASIHQSGDLYKTVHDNHQFALDPDSCLVEMQWEWIICHELCYAGMQYLRICTAVEREWLVDLPYFQDDRLGRKFTGELKNPKVKASLDLAREDLSHQS